MSGRWHKAEFQMMVLGAGGPKMVRVAGLVDGTFGLDRRKCYDFGERRIGYVVTHLKTGYAVRHLACNLQRAKEAVTILHLAEWSFSDADAAPTDARIAAVKAVDRLGFSVSGSEFEPAQVLA